MPSTVSEKVLEAARKALIHIQNIVPTPPKYIASETPAILPTHNLEPSVIKKVCIEVIPCVCPFFLNKQLNILLKWN